MKLTSVDKGLEVSWEPPVQLDGRPVDGYSIGYGKSMRSLRIIKVGKDSRSQLLEDVGKRQMERKQCVRDVICEREEGAWVCIHVVR